MAGQLQYVLNEIRKDLAAFADPGEALQLEASSAGTAMVARWIQGGQLREAVLTRCVEDFPTVEIEGRKLSYRSFLASDSMADLKRLAGVMTRVGYGVKNFVETRARHDSGEETQTGTHKATELIANLAVESLPWGATRVVFVKGAAGCGKTYVLKKLAEDWAVEYQLGAREKLFFYVDAQGKALARFDEAIAKELQDLRAPFTYHAIAPLTRRGLLIVIVDGFDELLGAGGYDEAFASLANFLGQVGGEGSLIASARSTFYDYKGFRGSALKFSASEDLNYIVEPVEIQLWGREEATTYFGQLRGRYPGKFSDPQRVYDDLVSGGGKSAELLQKPFYVARAAELYAAGTHLEKHQELLPQLVDKFVEREVDKLKDSHGSPILSKEGHVTFLTDLAEEMWWQETRQVDVATIQTLAELLAEQLRLSPIEVNMIVERAPTNAFLGSKGDASRLLYSFEHEMFYSFFLARRLQRALMSGGTDLREFIARGTLPEPVIEEALISLGWQSTAIGECIEKLGAALLQRAADTVARENAGRIFCALVAGRRDLPPRLSLRKFVIRQARILNATLESPLFDNCYAEQLDLGGTQLLRPTFFNTTFHYLIIDPKTTRLDGAVFQPGADIDGLFRYVGGSKERIGDPAQIADILRSLGATVKGYEASGAPVQTPIQTPTARRRIGLLDRFLRYADRTFYMSRKEQRLRSVFGAHDWRDVEKLLYAHHLVEDVVIEKSGPHEEMIRLRFPPDIIRQGENPRANVPVEIREFWEALVQD